MRYRLLLTAFTGLLVTAAPALAQTPVEKGTALFTAQKCAFCHSIAGKGNAKGPLDEAVQKLSSADIHKWLTTPAEMATAAKADRKPAMKSFATLPKEDLDALVAYLLSLKKQ